MPTPVMTLGETVWDLPPLILHPFNERVQPSVLLENSKAALMLAGLIPADGSDQDELKRRLLTGRYSEIRMLFFLGKDVHRWIGQCLECAARIHEFDGLEVREQSFAGLLAVDAPQNVREKLLSWGVGDYASIFSRALGINAIFTQPPPGELLAEEMLRHYHRYADAMYRCYMDSQTHVTIGPKNFRFDLYASGEYSRMLESQWGE
jgi:hypothetical protein